MTRLVNLAILMGALMSPSLECNSQLPSMKDAPKCRKLLDALQQEFESYSAKLTAAKTDAERQKARSEPGQDPIRRFMPKFEELAKAENGSCDGGMALVFLGSFQMQSNQTEAARQTLNAILRDYMYKPAMELMVTQLGNLAYVNGPEGRRKALDQVAHSASMPEARAAGLLMLAKIARLEMAHLRSQSNPVVEAPLKEILAKYPATSYAETAKGILAALGNLSVGKTAPEIVGEDQDGKPFKLSSYLGKVVVLDFWGFW
jgi:thiol-disulfide isomerase/thioredoxin